MDSNWRCFKQQFGLYMAAVGLDSKPDARKIALLLTVAGPQAIEVFNTFEFEDVADRNKYDKVVEKFDAHCSPQKNTVYESAQHCTLWEHRKCAHPAGLPVPGHGSLLLHQRVLAEASPDTMTVESIYESFLTLLMAGIQSGTVC